MKFTIRDLLWLMVVVGLGLAWWVDRSRLEYAKRCCESDARYLSELFNQDFFADERLNKTYLTYHPEKGVAAKPTALPASSAPAPNPSKK